MTVTVVTPTSGSAPTEDHVRVFLAGTIDMGNSDNWQARMIADISAAVTTPVVVFNPRRDTWVGESTTDNPEFVRQVHWEMDHLESADIIIMRLLAGSQSPISLLELGLHAAGGKLIVFCDEGFWRKGNVGITCERLGITSVERHEDLVAELVARIDRAVNKALE